MFAALTCSLRRSKAGLAPIFLAVLAVGCGSTPSTTTSSAEPTGSRGASPAEADLPFEYDLDDQLAHGAATFVRNIGAAVEAEDDARVRALAPQFSSIADVRQFFGHCWNPAATSPSPMRCDPVTEECSVAMDPPCVVHRLNGVWALDEQPRREPEQRALVGQLRDRYVLSYHLDPGVQLEVSVNGHALETVANEAGNGTLGGGFPIDGWLRTDGTNRLTLLQRYAAQLPASFRVEVDEESWIEEEVLFDPNTASRHELRYSGQRPWPNEGQVMLSAQIRYLSSATGGEFSAASPLSISAEYDLSSMSMGRWTANLTSDATGPRVVLEYTPPSEAGSRRRVDVFLRLLRISKANPAHQTPIHDVIAPTTLNPDGTVSYTWEFAIDNAHTGADPEPIQPEDLEAAFEAFYAGWRSALCDAEGHDALGSVYGVVDPHSVASQTETARAYFCGEIPPEQELHTTCDHESQVCIVSVEEESSSNAWHVRSRSANFAFRPFTDGFRACVLPLNWGRCGLQLP